MIDEKKDSNWVLVDIKVDGSAKTFVYKNKKELKRVNQNSRFSKHTDSAWYTWVAIILLIASLVFFGYALSGYAFFLLWNSIVAPVFSAPVLTFWQSVGLVVLLSLVGSFFSQKKA